MDLEQIWLVIFLLIRYALIKHNKTGNCFYIKTVFPGMVFLL